MNRKEFLKNTAKIAGACAVLPFTINSCKSVAYVPYSMEDKQMRIQKSSFGELPYVIFQPSHLPAPVYLRRLENGEYSALLLLCTHKACEVRPFGKDLQCPCHGSVFSNTGEVLESPAEQPLRKFEVKEDEEYVYVY